MGGELRQAEDDTAVLIAESDRALALSAIRLSQYATVLLSAHRSIQEGIRAELFVKNEMRDVSIAHQIYGGASRKLLSSPSFFVPKLRGNN